MRAGKQHAVVLGGSMAGLLAAQVLSEHFARVTLVERDPLDGGAAPRRGVPQGRHVHVLLARGFQIMARLFPDLRAALVAGGALVGDPGQAIRWYHFGGYKANFASGLEGVYVSRPFLESEVRRRVLALPNLTHRLGYDVEGLAADAARGRVEGAIVRNRASGTGERLPADLVVDATGRGSQAPRWLDGLGYAVPPEVQVRIDITYASRLYRRRPDEMIACFVLPEPPRERRAGGAFPIEGDRWIVTLAGYLGERPPQDASGFLDFARSLPVPDVAAVIARRAAERAGRPHLPRQPAALLRTAQPAARGLHRGRRRGVQLQPGLRPGDDRGCARGGGARRLAGRAGRARRPPLLRAAGQGRGCALAAGGRGGPALPGGDRTPHGHHPADQRLCRRGPPCGAPRSASGARFPAGGAPRRAADGAVPPAHRRARGAAAATPRRAAAARPEQCRGRRASRTHQRAPGGDRASVRAYDRATGGEAWPSSHA